MYIDYIYMRNSVPIALTVPKSLLKEIKREAEALSLPVSEFLRQAIRFGRPIVKQRLTVSLSEHGLSVTAPEPRRQRVKVKINRESGLPYFDSAAPISQEWIKEQLADFP